MRRRRWGQTATRSRAKCWFSSNRTSRMPTSISRTTRCTRDRARADEQREPRRRLPDASRVDGGVVRLGVGRHRRSGADRPGCAAGAGARRQLDPGRSAGSVPTERAACLPASLARLAAPATGLEPTNNANPGDGFLMRRGWTVAWCGWEWDVIDDPALIGLDAPQALGPDGNSIQGEVLVQFQPNEPHAYQHLSHDSLHPRPGLSRRTTRTPATAS